MDFQSFVNFSNMKEVDIFEVERIAKGSDIQFAFDGGKLRLNFGETLLAGDRYQLWIHLCLFLPSVPLEVDPEELGLN